MEKVRIDATEYKTFTSVFDELKALFTLHHFDPDLVINVDETGANAEEPGRNAKVLTSKKSKVQPMRAADDKKVHVTVTCAIAASGKCLRQVFIIKNKTTTIKGRLKNNSFDYGEYGIVHAPKGWQNEVIIIALYFFCFSFA